MKAPQMSVSAYWVEQMRAGAEFVERVAVHPIEDDGDPLLDIVEEARRAGVPLLCSETPHPSGRPRLFMVRAGIIEHLLAAASELSETGHTLLIEDAFRTREMQRELALSEDVLGKLVDALMKLEPGVDSDTVISRMSVVVARRPKGAGHMAGAAVDVTVLGPDGQPLDRGGAYPTVSEMMPMDSPFVSENAANNRRFVWDLMLKHGFVAFPFEFWHFSRDDVMARVSEGDPRPARYGPLDVLSDGRFVPAAEQSTPLYPREELARRLVTARVFRAHVESGRGGDADAGC